VHILSLVLRSPAAPPDPLSFPTRRSSDLPSRPAPTIPTRCGLSSPRIFVRCARRSLIKYPVPRTPNSPKYPRSFLIWAEFRLNRSEEHTSELQSRFDLVCRLLLEKKNKTV